MIANRRPTITASPHLATALAAAIVALAATPAAAYAGPGAGLSMIGSLIALVGAVLAGIFGFIWFPVKRLLKRRKAAAEPVIAETPAETPAKPAADTGTGTQP